MLFQDTIQLAEKTRGSYEITDLVASVIKESGISVGTCHLFIHSSTSAIVISDVADETTKNSTADFMAQLAPESIDVAKYINGAMETVPEETRNTRLQSDLTIPVTNGRPDIGVWQGIFLWESKTTPTERKLTVTISGEAQHKSFRLTRG